MKSTPSTSGSKSTSRTALGVARGLLLVARDSEYCGLVPPDSAALTSQMLARVSPWLRLENRLLSFPPYRLLVRLGESLFAPDACLHFALRKRFIEDAVRHAIDSGCKKVVVLGAGFDTLAFRLATELPDTTFLEVDHPATQSVKLRTLAELAPPDNLHFRSLDLTRSTGEDFCEKVGDPASVTCFIAEGTLMYLDRTVVDQLFQNIRAGSAPGSRFVFTYMNGNREGDPHITPSAKRASWLAKVLGEPFRSGMDRSSLAADLAKNDFKLSGGAGDQELREAFLPESTERKRSRLDWEFLALTVVSAESTPANSNVSLQSLTG